MSDAKQMAELAAEVAEKGYDWKQRAKASEASAESYLARFHEVQEENRALRVLLGSAAQHFDFLAKILRETKSLKPVGGKSEPTWKVAVTEAEAGAKAIRDTLNPS